MAENNSQAPTASSMRFEEIFIRYLQNQTSVCRNESTSLEGENSRKLAPTKMAKHNSQTEKSIRLEETCHRIRHFPKQMSVKPFVCSHCSKSFAQSSHLKEHLYIHTGEKPFACSQCSSSFLKSASLKRHLRIHNSKRPFVCSHCNKGFVKSGPLKVHLRIHTGEKPYVCPHCSMRFNQSSSFKKHLWNFKSERGEKPFACSQCCMSFLKAGYLKTHLRTHTVEKPYACPMCDMKFKQFSALNEHVGRIHFSESREENCLKSPEVEFFDENASSNAINGSSSVDNESIEAPVDYKEELHDDSDCEQIFHNDERLSIDATMKEDCVTLPGEVQVKDEPFSDVQVESVSSISSALFSEMNEVVGKVKNESEQDSLREVEVELDETYGLENVRRLETAGGPFRQVVPHRSSDDVINTVFYLMHSFFADCSSMP